jgi:hypothetical protein
MVMNTKGRKSVQIHGIPQDIIDQALTEDLDNRVLH